MTKLLLSISILLFVSLPATAQSMNSQQKTREFLMSCTYGILTGTLVGAASLAFTDNPGDNLHRVARGASLGLYAGIALGYYITKLDDIPGELDYSEEPLPDVGSRLHMIPLFDGKKIDGLKFQWNIANF